MIYEALGKRKMNESIDLSSTVKRVHTDQPTLAQPQTYLSPYDSACSTPSVALSSDMDLVHNGPVYDLPPRPKTPPLGMTLAHYDPSSGGYTASVVKSADEVTAGICTGMTPVYRAPMERWGSCLI
ncbi:uncharacterized protein BYT42DRAFT_609244 [Radiomyces spectabilis]|uniref:uncharacterized protein n=1 Tax=Radiomyces spectabilis TaxID=64574 RepID=UPI00222067E0|nr:uncharacterized protein BYT42DRAFT_609244 [Radiomyces spectabilis]KAI8393450.1 hypothetical protein BYT42DRAFT_609244 [Radiomyces spectabilis]